MSKYINPLTDFGFKYVFGREESKPFLIDFLNQLLADEPGFEPIVSLDYLDKEKSRMSREMRGVIYDIHCTTSNGRQFTVEMQNSSQLYFIERAIFYSSKAVVDQGVTGKDWQFEYMPVYLVSFLNFELENLQGRFRIDAALCDLETHKPISDKMRYIFMQLPRFGKKNPEECVSNFDKWMYLLINMNDMETMPFTQQRELFKRLEAVTSYASLNTEERRAYDADLKAYRDITNQLAYAGMKGEAKKAREIARNLKSLGIKVSDISSATGLSESEIKSL